MYKIENKGKPSQTIIWDTTKTSMPTIAELTEVAKIYFPNIPLEKLKLGTEGWDGEFMILFINE